MTEEEVRFKAIDKFENGKSPNVIYEDLARTKQLFFKWLRRFQSGDTDWYRSRSRAPLTAINEFDATPQTLPAATKLPRLKDIPDKRIVLIRFIRNNRTLDIFTKRFKVPGDLIYCYVKA